MGLLTMNLRIKTFIAIGLLGIIAACAEAPVSVPPGAVTVFAAAETRPVESRDDAADDPAIWVDPVDPAQSLILGTDKQAGLAVYSLDGALQQFLPAGELNNVDIRQGVVIAGRAHDIAAASNRTDGSVALFRMVDGELESFGAFSSGWAEPYGICMGKARDRSALVFANDKSGLLRKWVLRASGDAITGVLLGEVRLDSQPEGCVYDDATGVLFAGEEGRGIWRIDWSAIDPGEPQLIDEVGSSTGLTADVEGLAIYHRGDGGGYLIASSQGSHSYTVYELAGDNAFVGEFAIVAGEATGIDGTGETDGIEVSSIPLGPDFPRGLFVAQDGFNDPEGLQNFKLVDWREIENALGLNRP